MRESRRIADVSASLRQQMSDITRTQLSEDAHAHLVTDVNELLFILDALSARMSAVRSGSGHARGLFSIDELLQAAHYLVSIRVAEEELGLAHEASRKCLIEAGGVIMDLFYETVVAEKLGGQHPVHLIAMTASMAALQGLLNPAEWASDWLPDSVRTALQAVGDVSLSTLSNVAALLPSLSGTSPTVSTTDEAGSGTAAAQVVLPPGPLQEHRFDAPVVAGESVTPNAPSQSAVTASPDELGEWTLVPSSAPDSPVPVPAPDSPIIGAVAYPPLPAPSAPPSNWDVWNLFELPPQPQPQPEFVDSVSAGMDTHGMSLLGDVELSPLPVRRPSRAASTLGSPLALPAAAFAAVDPVEVTLDPLDTDATLPRTGMYASSYFNELDETLGSMHLLSGVRTQRRDPE